jgi:two-component system alkaline phosphatase synthesis response regulator PhoP
MNLNKRGVEPPMPKKILVVDDEPNIIKVLKSRLSHSGYDVITAVSGRTCLKKAKDEKPDLILLDILLPGLNGFEVCKHLKKDKETKDIPIIMLTSLAQEKDLSKGLEEGASCFITKPFNPADLLYEIKTAMDREAPGV